MDKVGATGSYSMSDISRRLDTFSNKEFEWDAWQANVEVGVAAVREGSWRVARSAVACG